MSLAIITESRRLLEQLRQDAQARAAQEAVTAASAQITARAARLFEGDLGGGEAPAPLNTQTHDDNWASLLSDLLAPAPGEASGPAAPGPGTETTTTTVELDVPDELLGIAPAATPDPAEVGGPATESPADQDAPTVNTPITDLTAVGNDELVGHVLDAPDDQQFELVPDSPAPATEEPPMEDNNPTARTFEDVLRETLGDVAPPPASDEDASGLEDGLAPLDAEADAEGAPADVDELAAALAALAPEEASDEPLEEDYDARQINGARRFAKGSATPTTRAAAAKNMNQAANIRRDIATLPAGARDDSPNQAPYGSRFMPSPGRDSLVDDHAQALDHAQMWTGDSTRGDAAAFPENKDHYINKPTFLPEGALNEDDFVALQEEFVALNEGVMLLAAKNKNQESEIQQLKEALARKSGQLDTVKGFLNEAITMTAKTALVNQLLVSNTTSGAEKNLIMEAIAATTSRQEAEGVAAGLQTRLQKNSLLSEQNSAQRQVTRVFSSEPGLLQESANQALVAEPLNPMVARWVANANYKSK